MKLPVIAFVDTETTGLDDDTHSVIELAVMRVEGDAGWAEARPEVFRFRPGASALAAADPEALRVNGYVEGHPDWVGAPYTASPAARDRWQAIDALLRGVALVGHNVRFDRGFLWTELIRYGLDNPKAQGPYARNQREDNDGPWTRRFVDTQAFGYGVSLAHDLSGWGLAHCYQALGGPALPQHRAEADVLRTLWLYAHGVRPWAPDDHAEAVAACCARLLGARPF